MSKVQAVRTIDILYEDDFFIVFDKPAGMLVIPTPKNERKTLVSLVNRKEHHDDQSYKLHPCHRLDRDTSGAIVFAKGKKHQKRMMDLFKRREVQKTYIAFVHGVVVPKKGIFRRTVKDAHRRKFHKRSPAQSAVTQYRVLEHRKLFSIVEVQPITGRTNQIRIHFAQAKHPLVGERKYAFGKDFKLKFRRTALHAASLQWTHPMTRKKVIVHSEIPQDMNKFINDDTTYVP